MKLGEADAKQAVPLRQPGRWPAVRRSIASNAKQQDIAVLALLVIVWFFCLVWRNADLPLQPWDESRNIVNAYGIAHGRGLLVTYYEGLPDHWQEKPALLGWCVAFFMKLGLPDLLALRLPSFLAVLTAAMLLWSFFRLVLRDRLAAFVSSALVLTSPLYLGIHIGRTGDYDALLSMFTLAGVLSFWMATCRRENLDLRWFYVCGASFTLAILTKGLAGLFGVVGVAAFAVVSGKIGRLARNYRVWGTVLVCLGVCAAYYLAREQLDPGYIDAVRATEFQSGVTVIQGHQQRDDFYFGVLFTGAPLVLLGAALGFSALLGNDRDRRSLTRLSYTCAIVFVVILSVSRSKLYWYSAPLVPLLAIAAGTGVSSVASSLAKKIRTAPQLITVVASGLLAIGAGTTFYQNHRTDILMANGTMNGQYWLGSFLSRIRELYPNEPVAVVDGGLLYQSGPPGFNPIARFYIDRFHDQGMQVTMIDKIQPDVPGRLTVTCDQAFVPDLVRDARFQVVAKDKWCVAGHYRPA